MQANKPNDDQLKDMIPKMITALKELQSSTDWTKNQDKPCQTFFRENGNRLVTKGVKVIPFTIEQITQFLNDESSFKKMNEQCILIRLKLNVNQFKKITFIYTSVQFKTLHQVPGKFKVTYTQIKLPWPLDNRQTVMILTKHQQSADKVYFINKSVNYPYPESKGVVRSETFIGGFILQRTGQKQTKVTTFGDFDPKGSIPDIVKKEVSKKRSQAPAKIQEKMKQKYGK